MDVRECASREEEPQQAVLQVARGLLQEIDRPTVERREGYAERASNSRSLPRLMRTEREHASPVPLRQHSEGTKGGLTKGWSALLCFPLINVSSLVSTCFNVPN